MSYLVVKILLLLALAALCGGLLAYWLLRRRFIDVTDEYERFIRASAAQGAAAEQAWRAVEERLSSIGPALAAIPPPDLAPIQSKLTLLDPLPERLEDLERAVAAIRMTDLALVAARLDELGRAVGALRAADLSPLEQRLAEVAQAQEAASLLAFSALGQRLSEIEHRLASLRSPDLGSLEARIDSLGARLSRFDAVIDRLHPVDLGPLADRIDRLQQQLDSLAAYLERQPAPAPPSATPPHSGDGRNLLKGPSFGPPDDLKRIRGVGPVLDRLLRRLGVFYFWQIAEWTKDDVVFVDDRLDVFKGRIERDAWVEQAARLAHEPGTAKLPSPSTGAATQGQSPALAP